MPLDYTKEEVQFLITLRDNSDVSCSEIGRKISISDDRALRIQNKLKRIGLLIQSTGKRPEFTVSGKREADALNEKLRLIRSHLTYEGMKEDSVEYAAYGILLCVDDDFYDNIRRIEQSYDLKQRFRDMPENFNGRDFGRVLGNGSIVAKFLLMKSPFNKQISEEELMQLKRQMPQSAIDRIRKESEPSNDLIAMGNDAFTHPAIIQVLNGKGYFRLQTGDFKAPSEVNGEVVRGRVGEFEYLDESRKDFVSVETGGEYIDIPIEPFRFKRVGNDIASITVYGMITVRVDCSTQKAHVCKKTATIFFMI